ncbi:MAG: right-handed parallel beta-helix repeat-containing protein [archaeon]|nr:right-handed parallel beta-helix repeat-containing protein [archaeon]
MKRTIVTITIAMLLIMPFLLIIPVSAQPTMKLSDAIEGGTGGEFYLDPNILYTGWVTIVEDTWIYGNGATIDLQWGSIDVTGAYLYIERCTITNGAKIVASGALQFLYGASGFVYDNIIVGNYEDGIYIKDSSNIVIKENSIIHNGIEGVGSNGIKFEDSKDITIIENTIGLYDDDPNSMHNIIIKGNKIATNGDDGIELFWVNDVSIASNLIYANDVDGLGLYICPIVSITYNKILGNSGTGIFYIGDDDWPDITTSTGDHTVALSFTISYNKIMGNGAPGGIFAEYTQNVVIIYNEIVGNEVFGIFLYGDFKGDYLMEPVLVAYNTISGNYYGIYMDYVSDVKILFNNIVGNAIYGIEIDGREYSEDILIKGNVVKENSRGYACQLSNFNAPVIIEWNTILGNGDDGIKLDDVESPQIVHNTIMYTYDNGIEMDSCDGARIAYNTISYNTGDNIFIGGSDDVIIEYNTIVGSTDDGIEADNSEDMTIQYNKIYDNEEDGIDWYVSSGLIANNIIGYAGSLSGNENGIYLDDCLSTVPDIGLTTISDNTIIGNDHGIHCAGSDPTIVRNYIANNVYGIWLESGKGLGSDATIGNTYDNRNYIVRNYKDGIYIADDASDPVINYNNIYGNVRYGVNTVDRGVLPDIDATYNWWGEMSGPGNPDTFGVGPGHGDEVSDDIDYIPWLTAPIP